MKPMRFLRTLMTLLSRKTFSCSRSSYRVMYSPIRRVNFDRISCEESTKRQSCFAS
jgi:hypothetical protein